MGGLPQAGLAPASSETSGGSSSSSAPDSSTAVTRYLIKHLPKQLTQLRYKQSYCQSKVYISSSFLRNQKHELEDKIHDLEQVVSEQRTQMAEYERRAEVEKSRAKKLEDSLHQVGAVARIYEAWNVSLIFSHRELHPDFTILSWFWTSLACKQSFHEILFLAIRRMNFSLEFFLKLKIFCRLRRKWTLVRQRLITWYCRWSTRCPSL